MFLASYGRSTHSRPATSPAITSVWVSDPRHSGRSLSVRCLVYSAAQEPSGYRVEDFDPGCGAEFDVDTVTNESGTPARLSARHLEAVRAAAEEEIDFVDVLRSDAPDDRDDD